MRWWNAEQKKSPITMYEGGDEGENTDPNSDSVKTPLYSYDVVKRRLCRALKLKYLQS